MQFHIIHSANISNAENNFGPNLGVCGEKKAAGRDLSFPGQEPSPEASGCLTPGDQFLLWIYCPRVPASLRDSEKGLRV